jgi:hypothetical protein
MRRKRPQLYLVRQDPTDIFNDMQELRQTLAVPSIRRPRLTETFARIPHDKALALHISGAAWRVLIELDRIILKHRGQNPVKFVSTRLRAVGLTGGTRRRALQQLVVAGVILVEQRGRGMHPWVTHLWYPSQD